jgi:hypothetical protein
MRTRKPSGAGVFGFEHLDFFFCITVQLMQCLPFGEVTP